MFKNKLAGALVLMLALVCGTAWAQVPTAPVAPVPEKVNVPAEAGAVMTVDDLLRSGKLQKNSDKTNNRQEPAESFNLASLGGVPAAGSAAASVTAHVKPVLSLIGIYMSKEQSRAAMDVSGVRKSFAVGDVVQSGWKLAHVTPSSVELQRCDKKKCTFKTLLVSE